MSNTDLSGLNHKFEVTLKLDDGREAVVPLYPEVREDGGPGADCSYPLPKSLVVVEDEKLQAIHPLLTATQVELMLQNLETKVQKILNAALVNEKQRNAVDDLIYDAFRGPKNALYE